MRKISEQGVTRRGFVKGMGASVAAAAMAGLTGCGSSDTDSADDAADDGAAATSDVTVEMVTDTGGINDQSFNQLAWEGMQQLESDNGWNVNYIESTQESDYQTNLDKCVDDGCALIWGVGFAMADAVDTCAQQNPDVQFAIIDNANPSGAANITGVQFRAQEPSFLVGYIAASFSTTGKVGFVGGISSDVIDQFEFGYKAGVAYANAQNGTSVEVQAQYAESFSDSAKGKSIAQAMFASDCDVVFHAAGGTGTGVIEAAAEAGLYAIGVDMDQNYLAPDNVITSALKRVNVAVVDVSNQIISGELEGGTDITLGLTEDCVGIPEDHDIIGDDIYNAAIALEDQIASGEIVPPASEEELTEFEASL